MHILEIGAADHEDINNNGVHPGGGTGVDPMFRTVSKANTTFVIWKIENAAVLLLPKAYYGTFYDGDCYIIYSCHVPGQTAGPNVIRRCVTGPGAVPCETRVHIWVGSRSTSLCSAAASHKALELDSRLSTADVLHREAEGHESATFTSYFRDGIKILRSEDRSAAQLFRVYGRVPTIRQLPAVAWEHFNSSGIYVLDAPEAIFLWIGRAANIVEKLYGAKVSIRLSRAVNRKLFEKRIIIMNDGYEQTLSGEEKALFQKYLELSERTVRAVDPVTPREIHDSGATLRLYSCYQAGSKYRIEEIKQAPLYQSDLSSEEVYIVDAGARGVWSWCGRSARGSCRDALRAARGYSAKKGYPSGAPVARVTQGREPSDFRALFAAWRVDDSQLSKNLRVARSATTRFDAVTLSGAAWLAAHAQLLDDGSGALRAWRGRRETRALPSPPLDLSAAALYDEDCYLVLYTYHTPNGDASVIYHWMGSATTRDQRKIAAKEAKDLYIKCGRQPIQVQVVQGKEPAHFLQIFKGRMITFMGKCTDYDPSGRVSRPPASYLARVSGQYWREARGTQETSETSCVERAPGACFILRMKGRVWLWCAAAATGDEREVAKHMAGAEHTLVMEGKEKEDFWEALGDKRHLLVPNPTREMQEYLPPRLFYISFGTPGHYSFEEIAQFSQYDLLPELIAVLDAHRCVYVWLGENSCQYGRDNPFCVARRYLRYDPAGRDLDTPIMVINQGREPPAFTGFFPSWKMSLWKGYKSFNAVVTALEEKSVIKGGSNLCSGEDELYHFDQHDKYPISLLKGPLDQLPMSIDPLSKELYLTHDDFVSTFGMPYMEFRRLPSWKQKDVKKVVGLF